MHNTEKFAISEEQKYHITDESINYRGYTLYRIEALKDFGTVKKGDKGGFVQTYDNLSHHGKCWLFDDSKCYESGKLCGDSTLHQNAEICGSGQVFGSSTIIDESLICGNAIVDGSSNIMAGSVVSGDTLIRNSMICGSRILGHALVSGCHLTDVETSGVTYLTRTNLSGCKLDNIKINEGFSRKLEERNIDIIPTPVISVTQPERNFDGYEVAEKLTRLNNTTTSNKISNEIRSSDAERYKQMLSDLCKELISMNSKWMIPGHIYRWYQESLKS